MADYRTEFPDFPAADMPAIPEGFADASWRNDACPSFLSEALGMRIWIDYADPQQRDHSDGCRFSLVPDSMDDDITDGIATDDWAAVLAAIEEERAQVADVLDQLEKADGAVLQWQLDHNRRFADAMLKRGLIRSEGDLIIHPKARKVTDLAFTMVQPAEMRVLYTGDNEGPSIMLLSKLIANFNASGGWYAHASEEDMRQELESRGWFEGLHANGHYLVLDLDHVKLEPHPDHPDNQVTR
ncbi:hypothetical protein [Bradyrhizobium zhanjiangense]|uniref:Uncharacterized protein n=1 Tax=Bradyrhizobium zhanjiangense TaxID=1325107 RepID=A0ABY0DG96_9BRAD|nr:hypothetical protein [Bradyrhizobium zhanjiangense]RXG91626.1 hypothetical protein EAS62_24410 [Bradyrhizobium zhanjiangense]